MLATASGVFAQDIVAEAELSTCVQKFSAAGITVAPVEINATFDNSLDTLALTSLEKKAANQRVLGRTVARLRDSIKFQLQHSRLPSGRICTRPFMAVQISYEPVTIFVASEYPPGSCEHRKILEHEQRHVAVHSLHLAELAPLLEADLRGFFAAVNPLHGSAEQAQQFVRQSTRDAIRARVALMAEGARARQIEVDTTEEISRLSKLRNLCANEGTQTPAGQ